MIDPISLSIAIGSIIISILTHVKHSKCSNCIEFNTYTPNDNSK